MANVAGCAPLGSNRNPQFVLLDFVDVGDGLKAVNLLNGLPASPTPTSTPTVGNQTSTTEPTSAQSNGAIVVRPSALRLWSLPIFFDHSTTRVSAASLVHG
ncbi:hypothetical protein K435DRAFT_255302 [Dendrothele bispora CBS 962.96]|uniref:Uncharacterized protein n=1 Tax=Dendrothele bispora (strain CBS 962.96) TaxID=1314807 RepID=A0A4V4HED0_DENBC|nr:hypothetical protein K435DRAFT_255302 [Dendrothele bispora CBS 962.96]